MDKMDVGFLIGDGKEPATSPSSPRERSPDSRHRGSPTPPLYSNLEVLYLRRMNRLYQVLFRRWEQFRLHMSAEPADVTVEEFRSIQTELSEAEVAVEKAARGN